MSGYFLSFFVTHLINFLLSLHRLLKITGIRLPAKIPVLCLAAAGAAIAGAASFESLSTRIWVFLLLLDSLLSLGGITGREDLQWLRGLGKR